ncbi:MAG: ferredoxin [Acidimicrobiales bacterium]
MDRLRVDPVACDAFGYCTELLSEVVWLDEWGHPVIDDAPVPPQLVDEARTAVRACPRKALQLAAGKAAGPPTRQLGPVGQGRAGDVTRDRHRAGGGYGGDGVCSKPRMDSGRTRSYRCARS